MKLGRYLVGLISGLTFGFLFAPKQGKKLRDELVLKGGESGHEALLALFKAFKEAGTDAAQEMKKLSENQQLQSALSMSKEKMRDYLAHIESGGYDLAEQAQQGIEGLSGMAEKAAKDLRKRVTKKKKPVSRVAKKKAATKVDSVTKKKVTRKKAA